MYLAAQCVKAANLKIIYFTPFCEFILHSDAAICGELGTFCGTMVVYCGATVNSLLQFFLFLFLHSRQQYSSSAVWQSPCTAGTSSGLGQ